LPLIPGHCDPTVNLFEISDHQQAPSRGLPQSPALLVVADLFVGIRNNRGETLWPITARGAMR
jgi:hypothetical protein